MAKKRERKEEEEEKEEEERKECKFTIEDQFAGNRFYHKGLVIKERLVFKI